MVESKRSRGAAGRFAASKGTDALMVMLMVGLGSGCLTREGSRDDNPFDSKGGGTGLTGASPLDGSGTSGDADDSQSGDGGHNGPRLDVGAADTDCGPEGCAPRDACTSVDVLFVIDNSGSMFVYQDALAEAFPTFVDAMYEKLPPDTDLHVAVTTSSFESGGDSHTENNCVPEESDSVIDANYRRPTEGMAGALGSGLQGRLVQWDSKFYYAANTGHLDEKQGLSDWFTAAGTEGVRQAGSAFEFNAAAAAWALHPANAETNSGFLRDEGSVLVIFILSDEGDQSYVVETEDFLVNTVLDAKSGCGGADCIVTGGLLMTLCEPETLNSQRFLSSFGSTPQIGDIRGGGLLFPEPEIYTEVVGATLASVIAETCEQIEPAG